jgi:hypothetical protein
MDNTPNTVEGGPPCEVGTPAPEMKKKKGEEVHRAGGEGRRQGGRGGSHIAAYRKRDSGHRYAWQLVQAMVRPSV